MKRKQGTRLIISFGIPLKGYLSLLCMLKVIEVL